MPARPSPKGRPRKYSDEILVDAALRVMGRDGYVSLTVRSLAEELGISHSALYTYVGAIEEIEEKAIRRLTDQIPAPSSSSAPGLRKDLMAYLQTVRSLLRLHPGVLISRKGSAVSEIFREISDQWFSALLPYAPDMRTLQLALSALIGTVLLIVEGERLLESGPGKKPSADALLQKEVNEYLNDLIGLVLPGLAAGEKGRKPASRRSKK